MTSPFSEPTKLVQIFGTYQSQVKGSMSTGRKANMVAEKRSLATRLAFDDTIDEFREPKQLKFNPDPFDSATGRKRFTSENTAVVSKLEKENDDLKLKIRELTAEKAGELAKNTRLETRLQRAELEHKKENVEWEQKLEKSSRLYKNEKEKNSDLDHRMKRLQEKQMDKVDRHAERRRQSLDKMDVLEARVHSLREERSRLETQVQKLSTQLDNRAEITPTAYKSKVKTYESEIEELRFRVQELEEKRKFLQKKTDEQDRTVTNHLKDKEELARAKSKVDMLQCELEANRDAVVQRKAMQDKLELFTQIERENKSLRSRNDLLIQTQGNIGLMNEQIISLTAERDQAELKAKDRDNLKADLDVARKDLKSWYEIFSSVASVDQQRALAQAGVQAAQDVLRGFQIRELDLVNTNAELKNELKTTKEQLGVWMKNVEDMKQELTRLKGEQAEQGRLVKKLQRKLLLVTKERDTSKAILASVEKEITLSGNQWEQERIIGLEKTLEEYRAMIDMLMEKDEGSVDLPVVTLPKPVSDEEKKKLEQNLKELQDKYAQLESKCERQEFELERRAIKGDFDPTVTKVIHFVRNPMAMAVEKKETEVADLKTENEALKARVKLLEEGQTKDITMMVGHRLEEGASSVEVEELKEQLKSADLKNQRIMELFKKTSKDFRSCVAQTTGYRIDKLGEDKYKFYPLYAESNEYLLFQKTDEEGMQLLESDYSLELSELMELHLEQNNSIPMFLAGLTIDQFRKQQVAAEEESSQEGDDGEEVEEGEQEMESEDGQESEEEEEGGDQQDMRSEGSGNSSDVICVDDD